MAETDTITTTPFTKVRGKYQVTIPVAVSKAAGFVAGDLLEASAHGAKIILTPRTLDHRGGIKGAIAQGLDDAKKGRIRGPFKNMAAFKRTLRRA